LYFTYERRLKKVVFCPLPTAPIYWHTQSKPTAWLAWGFERRSVAKPAGGGSEPGSKGSVSDGEPRTCDRIPLGAPQFTRSTGIPGGGFLKLLLTPV